MGPGNIVGFERKLDHGIHAPVQHFQLKGYPGDADVPVRRIYHFTAGEIQVVGASCQRVIQTKEFIELRVQPADVNIDAPTVVAVQERGLQLCTVDGRLPRVDCRIGRDAADDAYDGFFLVGIVIPEQAEVCPGAAVQESGFNAAFRGQYLLRIVDDQVCYIGRAARLEGIDAAAVETA